MEMWQYLRSQVTKVRDGYGVTPAMRKRLYAFLKLNTGWRVPSMPHKIGLRNYEWLLGLEKYGDEHGWYEEAMELAAMQEV
jgi:hypothetical protein